MDGEIRVCLETLSEKVDQLISAVLGNGHTGLIIRVDRIEQNEKSRDDLDIRLDRIERRASFLNKFMWIIIGGAIIATVTALANSIF